jgi:porin
MFLLSFACAARTLAQDTGGAAPAGETIKPESEATLFPVPNFTGDLWSRPRLTGDWGGLRATLANKGIQLEVDTVHIFQHVTDPGKDRTGRYGGSADYTLKFDTGKAGLWPGGFLKLHGETSFGHSVNGNVGSLAPVNGDFLFPGLGRTATALTNVSFIQFLAPWAGIVLGKLETYDADANEFADDHRTKFLNLGFDFNLVNALAPVSSLGAGIILVPSKDAILTLSVLDPNGVPTESGFDNFFKDGIFLGGEGRVAVKPFGLIGHQLLGFAWSNKQRTSLIQDPTNIARALLQEKFSWLQDPGPVLRLVLERFFPGLLIPAQPLNQERDAWSVYYNFDQYLWNPDNNPNRGLGIFFRFGVSDGKANPVKYHFNFGIGGKGIVPGREQDSFGIGWSRLEFSDNFVPFLRKKLDLGLEHEDTVELYYNFAVTSWLKLTTDLQVVEPAVKKKLSGGRLKHVNTAVLPGLRVKMDF